MEENVKEKIKVDQLEGAELDYWVAKAEGVISDIMTIKGFEGWLIGTDEMKGNPIDWNFIGKIIERDNIMLFYNGNSSYAWEAIIRKHATFMNDGSSITRFAIVGFGNSALESIKRCIIGRKYGEYVYD